MLDADSGQLSVILIDSAPFKGSRRCSRSVVRWAHCSRRMETLTTLTSGEVKHVEIFLSFFFRKNFGGKIMIIENLTFEPF